MAASVVAGPSSRSELSVPPAVQLLKTYAADDDSAEQALSSPTEEMQSRPQIRNRLQQGQTGSPSVEPGRPPEAETVLTSETRDHDKHPEGRPAAWRRLSGLVSNPFSPTTTQSENKQHDRGYGNFKYETLEKYTEGIPRLSALHDSNDAFSIYRRFGAHAARILLHRELEINEIATRLDELDEEDAATERRYRLHSIAHHKGWDQTQKDLIDQMEQKLSSYYDFLLKYTEIKALDKPAHRNVRCIYDWIVDNIPLEEKEVDYILHVDDFVLARSRSDRNLQGNRIEDFLEARASKNPRSLIAGILKTKDERRKTADCRVHHFSSSRLAIFANAIAVFLAVAGLLIPVFLLFLVPMYRVPMACLALGFVFAFSVTMALVSGARVQDLLVGTMAYGAVVIMFLGNLNQTSGSK